jgi:hypothetical protein
MRAYMTVAMQRIRDRRLKYPCVLELRPMDESFLSIHLHGGGYPIPFIIDLWHLEVNWTIILKLI